MQNDTIAHPPQPEHAKPPKKEGWRDITSTLALVLAAPLIAIVLTAYVFQSYEVEGQSMETTLRDNDRLVVWKLGKTWSNLINSGFTPKRGEVVIFHKPPNAGVATEGDRQLIKRVVGLPGERVVIVNGRVTIYNDAKPDGFNPDEAYELYDGYTSGEIDEVVEDGQVFVLGDNRNNSMDSRNFGTISTDQIVGSLAARIYPFNQFDTF